MTNQHEIGYSTPNHLGSETQTHETPLHTQKNGALRKYQGVGIGKDVNKWGPN